MSNINQFDQLKADITLKLNPSLEIQVSDETSMQGALLAGKQAKHFLKLVEEKRKELVKPLNDRVDEINAYAKSILEPVRNVEAHLKNELVKWEKVLEQRRLEEQKRIDEENRKKQAELEQKAKEARERAEMEREFGVKSDDQIKRDELVAKAEMDRNVVQLNREVKSQTKAVAATKVAGSRKVWTFNVTDSNLVPREFLCVDEKKIREAISSGAREIPGVHIFEETKIALR